MFKNIRPDTLEHLLEEINKGYYHIFAGGTDLMIRKRQWQGAERKFANDVIFISHLDELKGIYETDTSYEIYSCVTQSEVVSSDILPEYIKEPFNQMATISVRNLATVGGNIVNAASVADSLPVLYALDAKVVLRNNKESRTLNINDFILGKYKTVIKENEILEKVIIPKNDFTGYFYKKIGQRKSSILSKLSVYILYKKDTSSVTDLRIVVGAVNDMPIRLPQNELKLLESKNIDEYIDVLQKTMNSSDDKRSTKNYKEQVSIRLVRNFLKNLLNK